MKKRNNRTNLTIVTFESFPIGMGATNRIISWASALAEAKISISVFIVKPSEKIDNIRNTQAFGKYKGLNYKYLYGKTIWPHNSSKLHKFLILLICYLKLIISLIRQKPCCVISYTSDIYTKIILLIFRPIIRYRLYFEETEYPRIIRKNPSDFYAKFYKSLYKFSDGMLVMTNELCQYYKNIGARNIFLLPMTVDFERFQYIKPIKTEEKYFIYVGGSGGFVRDGVLDLIKAFHLFVTSYPDYKLLIVGPLVETSAEFAYINEYILKNSLLGKVILAGSRSSLEIPQLLVNSVGIAMTPPHNYKSGGFPTKLGEFLASGRPVISTKVSDIPVYLNESNSFLVDPGDLNGISEKMQYIVNNPVISTEIGLNGKKLAQGVFNSRTYANSLISYFDFSS